MVNTDIYTDLQDLSHLTWSLSRRSSGTAGSFLKSYDDAEQGRRYYKLSNFDAYRGITGHECVNELIVDRLLTQLGFPHLHYVLIHGLIEIDGHRTETWLCRSDDFKNPGEGKLAMDVFYQLEREENESPLEFCRRMGWEEYIDQMLLTDYLILNRDRHGANMEILRNRVQKTVRPAPLFDHGLSLLCSCRTTESIQKFDVMEDRMVQSFIGSSSTRDNLQLLTASFRRRVTDLTRQSDIDRHELLDGLDSVLSLEHLDRIWEMIERRWQSLESLCNS